MLSRLFTAFRTDRRPAAPKPCRARPGLERLESRDLMSGVTDWFSHSLHDSGLQSLARADFHRDHALTRSDLLGLFSRTESGGTISAAEFHDLQTIVGNASTLHIRGDVEYLAEQVVNGNPANAHYQGAALGNLYAGSASWRLRELVDKWFLGLDHPTEAAAEPKQAYGAATGPLFSGSGPAFTDVKQGQLGDCTFLASVAEVAARDNGAIKGMFISNGDGTYTVRFFENGSPVYVTVDRQLPGGGSLYDHPQGNLWVALVEKAYAQLNEEGWLATVRPGVNSYTALDNGDAATIRAALAALSGRPGSTISVNPSNIAADLRAGDLVVLGTDNTTTNSAVEHNHAYAVIAYNAGARQPFTLFNPWGVGGGKDTAGHTIWGEFTCDAAFLSADFAGGANAAATPGGESDDSPASALSDANADADSFGASSAAGLDNPPTQPDALFSAEWDGGL